MSATPSVADQSFMTKSTYLFSLDAEGSLFSMQSSSELIKGTTDSEDRLSWL